MTDKERIKLLVRTLEDMVLHFETHLRQEAVDREIPVGTLCPCYESVQQANKVLKEVKI